MSANAARRVGFRIFLGLTLAATARGDGAAIRLPNRVVEPSPGIEAGLMASLAAELPAGGVSALVQLARPPSADDRARLERLGIELRHYVGANTYIARIQRRDLSSVPGLRWAGPLLPKDKIATQLWNAVLAEPEPPNRTRKVVVYFDDGTSAEVAKAVIARYSPAAQRYGTIGVWALEIRQLELERLASEPAVFWIERLPDERFPLAAP